MPLDILKSVQLAYDYSQITGAHVNVVIQAAMEIKPRLKRAAQDVYAIGEQLNTVKDLIPHGQWTDWLNVEFELTDRTARNFMAVADRFAGKTEIISDLPPTALYLLAAPSTPDTVVEDVAAKAAAGERVRVADVKKAIAETKPATATVDDLTRHIGSWLSQQIGTPAETLTNAAIRNSVTRRHLENFLNRREVKFAVRTLEDAIAEVMSNVVNTGAADTQLTGPMPTMTHKDVADLKAKQARPELPTGNGDPKPLADWTQEDWNNYRSWNDQQSPATPTDNTPSSVEPPTPIQRTASGLPRMGLVVAAIANEAATPSPQLTEKKVDELLKEYERTDGWKISVSLNTWQAFHYRDQVATPVCNSAADLLDALDDSNYAEEFYFIDEDEDTPDSATIRKETEVARWAWGISRQLSDIHTKLLDASRDSLDHAPIDGPLLANINKAINHVLDAKTSLAKAISTGRQP